MTRGISVDNSLLSVFEHNQLSLCLFPVLTEFHVFEIYPDLLKVEYLDFKSENNNQEIQSLICNNLNTRALDSYF
jgi:hypothetical protein